MTKSLFRTPKGAVSLISAMALAALVAACEPAGEQSSQNAPEQGTEAASQTQSESQAQSESERLAVFFKDAFEENLDRAPMSKAYLGIKDADYSKWNNISDAYARESLDITKAQLGRLAGFDFKELNESTQLSYRLFQKLGERQIGQFDFRFHNYPVNQMFGWHTNIPSFLINIHRVTSREDAEAYISRLQGVDALMDQVIEGLETRQEMHIVPPKFVFPLVIEASRNVITGAPFTEGGDSTLLDDFRKKVDGLEIADEEKEALMGQAVDALRSSVGPAYDKLIAFLETQEKVATTDDGVWKLPDGDAFYIQRLENYTTTALTATEIHDIGLANVARIHKEMRGIMQEVGFEGSLQEFFKFMREDEQFYYANTEEGREAYVAEAVEIIETMKGSLDGYFGLKPQADLVVKRVEKFRENSAGLAFYQSPALDGSRPGTYYANTKEMADLPKYSMESLAYHEGIPGHHMQLAIAQELTGVPKFQKLSRFTAYTEGWGLYSEYLGREMGFYKDPYSNFGRLSAELWRACRLVVDTGLHDKKWTREEAIEYLVENTPNARTNAEDAINRYIVFAGQATAYLIGKMKILELREEAKAALGDDFDMRGYHDEVLRHGPLPLDVLEENIRAWISAQQAS